MENEADSLCSNKLLMTAVKAGDPQAVGALLDRYESRLFRYLFRTLGNREDAQDITQEVLIRILEKAHHYDGTYPLTPWVYRVAANLCTDHFRKKNFRVHSRSVDFDDGIGVYQIHSRTPEDEIRHREALLRVRGILRDMPQRQRRVLELRLLREFRLKEIAEAEGIKLGTVKSTLHSAMERLRRSLRVAGLDLETTAVR